MVDSEWWSEWGWELCGHLVEGLEAQLGRRLVKADSATIWFPATEVNKIFFYQKDFGESESVAVWTAPWTDSAHIYYADAGIIYSGPSMICKRNVYVGAIDATKDRGWNPGVYQPLGEDGLPVRHSGGREGSGQVGVQGGACQSAAFVPLQSPAGPKSN